LPAAIVTWNNFSWNQFSFLNLVYIAFGFYSCVLPYVLATENM
jgi:hypothetical protein